MQNVHLKDAGQTESVQQQHMHTCHVAQQSRVSWCAPVADVPVQFVYSHE